MNLIKCMRGSKPVNKGKSFIAFDHDGVMFQQNKASLLQQGFDVKYLNLSSSTSDGWNVFREFREFREAFQNEPENMIDLFVCALEESISRRFLPRPRSFDFLMSNEQHLLYLLCLYILNHCSEDKQNMCYLFDMLLMLFSESATDNTQVENSEKMIHTISAKVKDTPEEKSWSIFLQVSKDFQKKILNMLVVELSPILSVKENRKILSEDSICICSLKKKKCAYFIESTDYICDSHAVPFSLSALFFVLAYETYIIYNQPFDIFFYDFSCAAFKNDFFHIPTIYTLLKYGTDDLSKKNKLLQLTTTNGSNFPSKNSSLSRINSSESIALAAGDLCGLLFGNK